MHSDGWAERERWLHALIHNVEGCGAWQTMAIGPWYSIIDGSYHATRDEAVTATIRMMEIKSSRPTTPGADRDA